MTERRNEHGLALVVVLWGIAAMSLIAAAMLSAALTSAHIGRNAWRQLEVQTAADAGIQSAILTLFDPRPEGQAVLDGRQQNPTVIAGITVTAAILDEAGSIDVNAAGRNLLHDFFVAEGVAPDAADTLADRMVDWRSGKQTQSLNGATAGDYEQAGYAYRPRGGPFQSVDEASLVMGMTPALFRRVAPALTVYSHSTSFDTRFAPREVLAAIGGMDPQKADQIVASRLPAAALLGHAFRITVTAERGQTRFSRRAVVLLTGVPGKPYRILDWR
ncbi:MAG: hypothetical protein WDN03_07810 [Rhizomicrobium sp.]